MYFPIHSLLLYNVKIAFLHVQKYKDWKDGLPDLKWLEDAMPQGERWSQFSRNLLEVGSVVKNAIDIGESRIKTLTLPLFLSL